MPGQSCILPYAGHAKGSAQTFWDPWSRPGGGSAGTQADCLAVSKAVSDAVFQAVAQAVVLALSHRYPIRLPGQAHRPGSWLLGERPGVARGKGLSPRRNGLPVGLRLARGCPPRLSPEAVPRGHGRVGSAGPWDPGWDREPRAIDRLPAPPPQTGPPARVGPRGVASATPSEARPRGQALEAGLEGLAQQCQACRSCSLALGRQQVVVSRGNPQARLMLIGEAPGAQEDELGQPFVGRSGQLLDQLLAAAGLDSHQDVYIGNAVKCRPPGNRKPTALELAACRPWLQQQIALVQPQVLVLVGATALQAVLGLKGPISQLRGQWTSLEGRACMPIFHPAYLLRNGSTQPGRPRDLTRLDLVAVREHLRALR